MMPHYICVTCGVQYDESEMPPEHCLICEDERQYVPPKGQQWTTQEDLAVNHENIFKVEEDGLTSIRTEPRVAIGQQAYVIETPHGNVLWDCISYLDEATVQGIIQDLGGVVAMAVSHPHFYSSMVEWSRALGNVPIYLHESAREWVMRPDENIVFFEEDQRELVEGVTVLRCGGHFPCSAVLHWVAGAEGQGVLLTADTISVVADLRYVTFMYSFPNTIPLGKAAIDRIVEVVSPLAFERIYGGWGDSIILKDGKSAVLRSAERYIRAIEGKL